MTKARQQYSYPSLGQRLFGLLMSLETHSAVWFDAQGVAVRFLVYTGSGCE